MSEYVTEDWKKWSTVYCSKCFKPLAHYKGWFGVSPVAIECYCKKCQKEIQNEECKKQDRQEDKHE